MIAEPIAEVLTITGNDLTFYEFVIKGIPGFELSTLYKGETTLYEQTKQDFKFQIASASITLNNIVSDMEFYITDTVYKHIFKVSRTPTADLTGWSVLHVDYISKQEL